jgi:nicotinamide-nucleotide amidase
MATTTTIAKTKRDNEETMRIAILSIGLELLKGFTVNRDLSLIGQTLTAAGMPPCLEVTVSDDPAPIRTALAWLLPQADVVITTGGLGPTGDDRTVAVLAEHLGLSLVEDAASAAAIHGFWSRRRPDAPTPQNVLRQALIPQGSRALPNRRGTAPGVLIATAPGFLHPEQAMILLPGPPNEMLPMFQEEAMPYLLSRRGNLFIHTETSYAVALPESVAEERIIPVLARFPEVDMAYCATPDALRLHVSGADAAAVAQASAAIRHVLADHILTDGATSPAAELVQRLAKLGWRLATAESCTGGMIAEMVTSVPGSSACFVGGIVSYANDCKEALLGVAPATLAQHGAVSEACVREMVAGVTKRLKADAAVAVTGIAGPGGGTPDKPVGLVFVAAAVPGKIEVRRHEFPGDREQVRHRAAIAALCLLRETLPPDRMNIGGKESPAEAQRRREDGK